MSVAELIARADFAEDELEVVREVADDLGCEKEGEKSQFEAERREREETNRERS